MGERTLGSVRKSTYDRRRLFDKDVTPTPLSSMREVTWEHQAIAMQLGYKSVAEMAVDELLDMVVKLAARVESLEGSQGCELIDDDEAV